MSRLRVRRDDGALGLLAAILEGTEDLRGARCVDYPGEFDVDRRAEELGYADEGERWAMCTVVCRACPARGACWAWATATPPTRRPVGPLAITLNNPFRLAHIRAAAQRSSTDLPRSQGLETVSPSPLDRDPPPARPGRPGARRRPRPSRHRRR